MFERGWGVLLVVYQLTNDGRNLTIFVFFYIYNSIFYFVNILLLYIFYLFYSLFICKCVRVSIYKWMINSVIKISLKLP